MVTGGIFYCRDSAGLSVSASNKLSRNLTGTCFEIGNKNIPPPFAIINQNSQLPRVKAEIAAGNPVFVTALGEIVKKPMKHWNNLSPTLLTRESFHRAATHTTTTAIVPIGGRILRIRMYPTYGAT